MPPLHTARSCASSCFSINFFMSFATHSFQVFLPLPLTLFPSTSIFLHADTQSSVSLRSTCKHAFHMLSPSHHHPSSLHDQHVRNCDSSIVWLTQNVALPSV